MEESIFDENEEQTVASFSSSKVEEPKKIKTGRKFIIDHRQVDSKTIIAKRKLLTWSRCTVPGCDYDVAIKNGYQGGGEFVPNNLIGSMQQALAEHVIKAHSRAEEHIIEEEVLPKQWLGAERGIKIG